MGNQSPRGRTALFFAAACSLASPSLAQNQPRPTEGRLGSGFNYGAILHTTDGGQTWVTQNGGEFPPLNGVSFADETTGVAVGDLGVIRRTTDGGDTWTPQESGTCQPLNAVQLIDAKVGTVVGNGGTILRTMDGGETWASQTSGTSADLTALSFQSTDEGVAVGSSGTIVHTADGGETWVPQRVGGYGFAAVSFAHALTGYAVAFRDVYRTDDGGDSWQRVSTIPCAGFAGHFRCPFPSAVFFAEPDQGWIAGWESIQHSEYLTFGKLIMRTENRGLSWTRQYEESYGFNSPDNLRAIAFVDSNVGFAVGRQGGTPQGGCVLSTADGGTTWTQRPLEDLGQATGLSFIDAQAGWIVGKD